MKLKIVLGVRLLLGLVMFGGGIFWFLMTFGVIAAPPPEFSPKAAPLMTAMMESGLLNFVKLTEMVCGALLLLNLFVPLALTVLAPVVLNIAFICFFLDPQSFVVGIVLLGVEIFLAYAYRESFRVVLQKKATPA